MAISRRGFLGLGASFVVGAVAGLRVGLPGALGPGTPRPLGGEAQTLVDNAMSGLNRARLWDSHVHVVGVGAGGTGCWVNPKMRSFWAPIRNFKFDVYRAASGITDMSRADSQFVERLLELHKLTNPAGKLVIMAFDYCVNERGEEVKSKSDFYVPNEYVFALAKAHPEFVPCASIHPYRKDAVERLDRAVEAGARAVKWLPNAMQMDPSNALCDPFYKRLATLGLPLISHGGEELAVDSPDAQELGNPLRLRRALDAGVRVVVAHCASLGKVDDLDLSERRPMKAFDAFMRLFTDKRYEKNLFADISAITQFHRANEPLREILTSIEVHSRLVNGSDYPLPCIDPLISTRMLVSRGYLRPEDRSLLNEIFDHNPLLFDFVVKRRVRVEAESQTFVFPPGVFESAWLFERPPATA